MDRAGAGWQAWVARFTPLCACAHSQRSRSAATATQARMSSRVSSGKSSRILAPTVVAARGLCSQRWMVACTANRSEFEKGTRVARAVKDADDKKGAFRANVVDHIAAAGKRAKSLCEVVAFRPDLGKVSDQIEFLMKLSYEGVRRLTRVPASPKRSHHKIAD